jgi:hypothetical protein
LYNQRLTIHEQDVAQSIREDRRCSRCGTGELVKPIRYVTAAIKPGDFSAGFRNEEDRLGSRME